MNHDDDYNPEDYYLSGEYAMTLKIVSGEAHEPTKDDYEQHLYHHMDQVHRNMKYTFMTYERDKHGRLHLHCLLEGPKKLFLRKLQYPGINLDIQPLKTTTHREAWIYYLQKDIATRDYLFDS